MKNQRVNHLLTVITCCAVFISSCSGIQGADAIQSWLDEPLDGTEIATGQTITLRAHARDHNGQGIVEVKFLVNGEIVNIVETDSSLPLVHATTNWTPGAPGTYVIEAMAVGWSGTKNSVRATVSAAGGENIASGGNEVATVYYPPEIVSVSGPSSIPADGQSYEFTITFRDQDGDIRTINVNANNWSDISLNVPQQIASGDLTYGTIQFRYKCPVGTNSFSDTLNIYASDANGKASASYSFPLACEGQSAPPPQITYPPIITSVDGPSTITADSGRQYFRVSFTDADGDADRLVVKSDQGRWGTIDFGSPLPLDSGNSGNGVVSFYYTCSSSSSFSDTLRITIYDAAGNASNAYPFDLGCKRPLELEFPPQIFGTRISLSFPGGHASIHKIGESAQLCYTFTNVGQIGPEGAGYSFYLYDFQPATQGSYGVDLSGPNQVLASGWASDGTKCFDGSISGPQGYEAFRLELYKGLFSTLVEVTELWIYVQP